MAVRLGLVVGVVGGVLGFGVSGGGAESLGLVFSGSALADGVSVTVVVPSAPGTDTPVDGGGPTAQVSVDSLGSSTGYAAFPNPGGLVISGPGLLVGLLAGGAAGLPPVKLPSPPAYPFFVQSDVNAEPEQVVGAGPYELSAKSGVGSSVASARVGFRTDVVGNAALALSTALVGPGEAGDVVATATSDVQGLTVGPLSVGRIRSTATQKLDSSGAATPSSSLEISGVRVGTVGVSVVPDGVVVGGPMVPVPVNATLASLLKPSGIRVEVQPAQQFPDRVVAPALRITMPFAMPVGVPQVGQFSGTVTVTVGAATAALTGAGTSESEVINVGREDAGGVPEGQASPDSVVSSMESGPVESGPVESGPVEVGSVVDVPAGEEPVGEAGSGSSPATGEMATGPVAPSGGSSPSVPAPVGVRESRLLAGSRVDLGSSYVVVLVGAGVAMGAAQLIRLLGVRKPWTSTVG